MSDESHDDPKLSDAARDLLRSEKNALLAAPGKDRVRARLDASLFGGTPGGGGSGGAPPAKPSAPVASGASGASSARWLSHVLIGLGGVVTGVVLTIAVRKPEIVQAPPTVVSVYVDRAPPTASNDSPLVTVVTTAAPSASTPTTSSATATIAQHGPDTISEERALLDPARTALGRNDGTSALSGVKKHEQRFPKGQLTEEREAIAVQALVALGRYDEAKTRADHFKRSYPNSVLAPAVTAALDAIPK